MRANWLAAGLVVTLAGAGAVGVSPPALAVPASVPASVLVAGTSSGCPPTSSLCNPAGMAVLAASDAAAGLASTTVATAGTATGVSGISTVAQLGLNSAVAVGVAATGYSASVLHVEGGANAAPGVTGLAQPYVEPGFEPTQTFQRPVSSSYPVNSTAYTTWWIGQEPEYGARSGTLEMHWSVEWLGKWDRWNEPGGVGYQIKCVNGDAAGWSGQPRAYRGASPGGPGTTGYAGTGTIVLNFDGSTCWKDKGGIAEIAFTNALNLQPLGVYRLKGHPDRSPGIPAGYGTFTRMVTCVGASDVPLTIRDDWHGTIAEGGDYEIPALSCPDGMVAASFGATWTSAVPGAATQTVIPTTATPQWVRDIPTEYGECLVRGADCRLHLYRTDVSPEVTCGPRAADCIDWYVDPSRGAKYGCGWGPYPVDLSFCAVFRDPGRILATGAAGPGGTIDRVPWPILTLDTDIVSYLRSRLVNRYENDADGACRALGEGVRYFRGDAGIVVPDVTYTCINFGVQEALEFVVRTGGIVGAGVAIDALARVSLFGPFIDNPRADCDRLVGGVCQDIDVYDDHLFGPSTRDQPDEETLRVAVNNCSAMLRRGYKTLSRAQALDECSGQPVLFVGGRAGWGRQAARHDLDVIRQHPALVQLEYMSTANKEAAGEANRTWYKKVAYLDACASPTAVDGAELASTGDSTDCDEYPFFATVEGGERSFAEYGAVVLRRISRQDNRIEGAAYGAMAATADCRMESAIGTPGSGGTKFLTIPLVEVDVATFFVCPPGE